MLCALHGMLARSTKEGAVVATDTQLHNFILAHKITGLENRVVTYQVIREWLRKYHSDKNPCRGGLTKEELDAHNMAVESYLDKLFRRVPFSPMEQHSIVLHELLRTAGFNDNSLNRLMCEVFVLKEIPDLTIIETELDGYYFSTKKAKTQSEVALALLNTLKLREPRHILQNDMLDYVSQEYKDLLNEVGLLPPEGKPLPSGKWKANSSEGKDPTRK